LASGFVNSVHSAGLASLLFDTLFSEEVQAINARPKQARSVVFKRVLLV